MTFSALLREATTLENVHLKRTQCGDVRWPVRSPAARAAVTEERGR
ncbi:MAG: hypothetical protein IJT61_01340 [Bacteroidales bacterium]|nr:hypothetical protein [Bacteroidales bacterium]